MNNQKPSEKIVVIDFDGTLCEFKFPNIGPIKPHVKEASVSQAETAEDLKDLQGFIDTMLDTLE